MTDVDELTAWLRAQLDEDAEAARKAASRCGCHPPAPNWLFDDESTGGRILVADDPHADIRHKLTRRWNGSYNDMFAAEHIARHDPARELREVDAKRRLIDLHRPGDFADCRGCGDPHPCATAKLLALPCADRPGYREEWRP